MDSNFSRLEPSVARCYAVAEDQHYRAICGIGRFFPMIEGSRSLLRNLTIEEYRAERALRADDRERGWTAPADLDDQLLRLGAGSIS